MRKDTTEPGERKPKEKKNQKDIKMERTEMIFFFLNGSQKKNDLHSGQEVDVCLCNKVKMREEHKRFETPERPGETKGKK